MRPGYEWVNLVFGLVVIVLTWYYLKNRGRMEEMSRRLILVGIMFSAHELSFLLHDKTIYQMTEIMLMLILFYALIYVTEVNKRVEETTQKLEDAKEAHDALLKRLKFIKENMGQ